MCSVLQRGASLGYGALCAIRKRAIAGFVGVGVIVGAALPVLAEPTAIAALGDSLTQGYGLAPDQGLVPVLERWLLSQGETVRLINAGVSGDTTAGGLARAAWTLTPDVQGLIVALGANDMLRGIEPEVARANLAGILSAAKAASVPVLLVGFAAPGNFGPDYRDQFDAIYPDLAAEFGTVLMPNLVAALADDSPGGAALTDFLQADRLHPNPAGVALIVKALGPKVQELLRVIE